MPYDLEHDDELARRLDDDLSDDERDQRLHVQPISLRLTLAPAFDEDLDEK